MLRTSFAILSILGLIILVSDGVYAQSDDPLDFRSKGVIIGEDINGGIIWVSINDDKATTIVQWDLGRVLTRYDVSPSSDCEPNYSICLLATSTYTHNAAATKLGDQFLFKINPETKTLVIDAQTGTLQDIDIVSQILILYKHS